MTDYGITPTGFNRKTLEIMSAEVAADLRRDVSENLILDELDPVWTSCLSVLNQLAQVWEVAEDVYLGLSRDDATGDSLAILGRITGYRSPGARAGYVTATVTASAPVTVDAGAILACVKGLAANRWRNLEAVTLSAGANSVLFGSDGTGPDYFANAGTLTVLLEKPDAVTAIYNAADATPGTAAPDDDAIRLAQEANLAARGACTLPALRAALAGVSGVLAARTVKNSLDVTAGGIPPRGLWCVVWAGESNAADPDSIAAIIANNAPDAWRTFGSQSVNVEIDGETVPIRFDWAQQVPVFIELTISGSFNPNTVRDAILTGMDSNELGATVIRERVRSLCWIYGVTDVPSCKIGSSWTTAESNLSIPAGCIATFDAAHIKINGSV